MKEIRYTHSKVRLFITKDEYDRRIALGGGGYGLHINAGKVYDCYRYENVYKAGMMTNTTRGLVHVVTKRTPNANLVIPFIKKHD